LDGIEFGQLDIVEDSSNTFSQINWASSRQEIGFLVIGKVRTIFGRIELLMRWIGGCPILDSAVEILFNN
jgi:hypothetical protein